MPLTPAISSYLDLIRFISALSVVLTHANLAGLGTSADFLGKYGHTAVIVFFILSGYIICRTTIDSNRDFRYYLIIRFSRIYTVAIPAILLSIIISIFLRNQIGNINEIDSTYREIKTIDIINSLAFMNQSWLNESQLSLNVPYWSLCYEFWYYILFAFLFFIKNIKLKVTLVILVLAIVGPGIAALFPIWLMGAGLAKYNTKFNISSKIWFLCTLIPILIIVAIVEFKWDTSIKNIIGNEFPILYLLRNSTKLITDNLIGLLLLIHLATLKFAPEILNRALIKISPVSKYLAGFSFSLYLFHDPLLRTSAIFLPNENDSKMHLFLVVSLVICICWIFSFYTEKNAPYVRSWILKKTNLQN